jgi:hypothetical protein
MRDTYLWIVAPYRQDRLAAFRLLVGIDAPSLQIDCHHLRCSP